MIIIPDEYFHYFEEVGTVRQFHQHQMIYMREESADDVYLIKSGRVFVYVPSPEGGEMTLEVLKKGRIFGDSSFVSKSLRQVNIEAVTDCCVVVCESRRLLPLLHQSEELMILMFQHLTETCNQLTHQITRLVYYDSEQKVADLLLEAASEPIMSIPYTHQDIAYCLNMNRVTVSKILKRFKDQGLVDYQYGSIKILRPEGLKALIH